jgi:hypothetical protein
MGRVEFGVEEMDDEQFRPIITIALPDGKKVEFITKRLFDNEAQAKEVVTASYLILSGDQKNVRHSPTGEL